MTVTILAVGFLAMIVAIAIVGYRMIMGKQQALSANPNTERCAICREQFDKSELVERQIGDYKLLFFCRKCVLGLYGDLGMKN